MAFIHSKTSPPSKSSSDFRKVETVANAQTLAEDVAASKLRFNPAMPNIPGVIGEGLPGERQSKPINWGRAIVAISALLILGGAGAWLTMRTTRHDAAAVPVLTPTPAPDELPAAPVSRGASSNEIGTTEELAAPWAAKKFTYTRTFTREQIPAIAIRLPGGNGQTTASYWVILMRAPFGQCRLEYIIDTNQIASRFGFNASHPMIADPCSSALYDPMRMGTLPNGSWARGEIVHGSGFRPPMQIEIHLDGNKLIAGRAED
jgi:hypothetical protein